MIVSEVAPPTPSAGLLTCDLTESSRFHVSRTCWWRHNWNTGTATELPLLLEAQARSLDPSRKLWPAVTGELVSACGAFEGPPGRLFGGGHTIYIGGIVLRGPMLSRNGTNEHHAPSPTSRGHPQNKVLFRRKINLSTTVSAHAAWDLTASLGGGAIQTPLANHDECGLF
jgi:hypothetical protein